jgi:hypothetical protein
MAGRRASDRRENLDASVSRPARALAVETVTSGGWCATLGSDRTITVIIPRKQAANWYEMDACLRGPGLAQQEAEISSILESVHISSGY